MMDDSRFKGQPEAPRSAGSYQLDMDLVPRNVWRSCTLFFPWSGQDHVIWRHSRYKTCKSFGTLF